MKYADFTWLSKQYVRGFQGTRTGGTWGPVWDKSLLIVSLYRNGIGAKDISRFLFGTTKELPAILNCVKAHGVFEPGRKPPGAVKDKSKDPIAYANKETVRALCESFTMDNRQWIKGVAEYERAIRPKWDAATRRMFADPKRRIKFYLRKRLRTATASKRKYSIPTDELIGCTPEALRKHLESQFKPEWNWDNYGSVWQIDHITPCKAFDLTDNEQAKRCFHYSNLRPLCRIENIRKGDKMPDGTRARHAA